VAGHEKGAGKNHGGAGWHRIQGDRERQIAALFQLEEFYRPVFRGLGLFAITFHISALAAGSHNRRRRIRLRAGGLGDVFPPDPGHNPPAGCPAGHGQ